MATAKSNSVRASISRHWILAAALSVVTVNAQPCSPCHAEVVKSYQRPDLSRLPESQIAASGAEFLHGLSSSTMRVEIKNGRMTHTVGRDGLEASYPVALAIGSGRVGQSFAVLIDKGLFQSPISWYKQALQWEVSPGFERERHPDFDRPITASCLFCHSSPGRSGPAAIGCERCHGDGAKHAAAPGKANIIHPSRLPFEARDAICEQCHLQGAARIVKMGKSERDYLPGMRMEDVFSIFVRQNEDFRVVSHAEQLKLSACLRASADRFWCGTCHNPHPARPVTRADYRQRCESCHLGIQAKHRGAADDCVGCHMPARTVSDVAHTTYTDHRISKHPTDAQGPQIAAQLKAWRQIDDGGRALALAYAATGDLAAASFHLAALVPQRSNDVELLIAAGSVSLGLKRPVEALRYFGAARRLEPKVADHYFRQGLAREAMGEIPGAAADYREALRHKKEFFDAAARLANLERRDGDLAAYKRTLKSFLETMPQNMTVRRLLNEVSPSSK